MIITDIQNSGYFQRKVVEAIADAKIKNSLGYATEDGYSANNIVVWAEWAKVPGRSQSAWHIKISRFSKPIAYVSVED